MTDPRLAWLEARLAEDEATAKAATPGPWYWDARYDIVDKNNSTVIDTETVRADDAHHVLRWDPARALAVVAALRRVLELHQPDDEYAAACTACADERTFSGMAHWPCPTVRAIASIWADRDGYAEEWGDA